MTRNLFFRSPANLLGWVGLLIAVLAAGGVIWVGLEAKEAAREDAADRATVAALKTALEQERSATEARGDQPVTPSPDEIIAETPEIIEGPKGDIGPAGRDGEDGRDGITPPCVTAPGSCVGAQGPVGPAGAAGKDGRNGVDGATGPVGPGGPTGPAGADGATGPAGPAGADGATGPVGPTGPQGPASPVTVLHWQLACPGQNYGDTNGDGMATCLPES